MSEERGTTAAPAEDVEETAASGAVSRDGRDRADDQVVHPDARPATFRAVPTVALVAIGFLALCLSPIAFQGGVWFLLFLIPLAAAVWVVRSRTRVDAGGVHVRRVLGTRSLAWSDVTTLRLDQRRWVRAVPREGADLELRGVRIRDLGRVGEASGGRISAPSPADAEAAAEHARELEAARMRVARLRDQQDADGPGTARAEAEQADGGGVGGLDAEPGASDGEATRSTDGPETGTGGTSGSDTHHS
ncbi:PH domain-containing protein [Actinomycetospora sp. TBRC 11914]|uniref:PH domain-containing protein n=1 Tax=Actinomycetospora sp. TBRC 11914 TaxID=2729387 RepID=UPI00145CC6C6|nr:PH domain-containing protein [Actinomycetospora sp. TBRC 11914]NMO91197.1 PH domain-containing protein [Actinomycetospora sp. TBRC 11914]